MGLGGQLIYWPDGFCSALADRGFLVVRYDNRDVGLSSRIEVGPRPDLAAIMQGEADSAYHARPTWPPTGSACSTPSASTPPTWSGPRWAG